MAELNRDSINEPTSREWRVIELVAQGLHNRDVAKAIGRTEDGTKNCLRKIYDKLGLWNRVELALWYERRKYEVANSVRA